MVSLYLPLSKSKYLDPGTFYGAFLTPKNWHPFFAQKGYANDMHWCPSHVRSHSHDSSFMHSDVSLFYSYTVVAETHFVIVTVPLVRLFMP
jgi:hypothetical protein